jgi:hypothetical protein
MAETDTHGIVIEEIAVGAKSTLKGKRRRFRPGSPLPLDTLPHEWHSLLKKWLKRGGNSRWETLVKDAGTTHLALAESLLNWLLRHGWAIVEDERRHGSWWPQSLELRNLPQLRDALGINDKEQDAQHWQALREMLHAHCDDNFAPALLALDELPVHRALTRQDLIATLQRWQDTQQSGTRRDFALFARNDTKGLSESEWNWLEQTLDLAEFRIERHTPLLLLSAPLTLNMPRGQIDLTSCVDFAALTPATLQATTAASGTISRWQLVENRTSFERVARQREYDVGVIWLPGFPPNWWRSVVGQLLDHAPAPAYIACDPDPAGIAIALKAAELWRERGIAWLPWKMSATDLAALRVRKLLTEVDRLQLAALRQETVLPTQLSELAEWMLEHGEKGEQEGYL